MRIGILSDTHGQYQTARIAVATLQARSISYLIHCGDIGEEEIFDLLVPDGTFQTYFVWGNNDFDRRPLKRYAAKLGIHCLGDFGTLELAGKRIAVTHGDSPRLVQSILDEQSHDYLLTGHTHIAHDRRSGGIRLINPGALFRARRYTVATLDLVLDKLEFVDVGRGAEG
jgi:putative phosphoesterase